MAPKKLTDCPENLREAIDWLIQVRHGSGDGKGLEHLAKAVEKLTTKAIVDSLISIIDSLTELIDPYCAYMNCCKPKITAIVNLQKEIKQAENIEGSQFKTLLQHLKDVTDIINKNHRVDLSRDETLTKVQSRLSELDELSNKLSDFTRDPKGKLERLCEGVENFLGYKRGGIYDGTGIVYGDCNRLGDAVLMFLYGVLDCVKDDESVSKYDVNKHLSKLPAVIKEKLFNGLHDFSLVLSQVSAKLAYHEGEIKKRINAVVEESNNGTLKLLQRKIGENIAMIKAIDVSKPDQYDEAANKWYDTATNGLTDRMGDVVKAIKNLDKPLKNKIIHDFEKIRTEIQHLKKKTTKEGEELGRVSSSVKRRLGDLESRVSNHVEKISQSLQKWLIEQIDIIKSHITAVDRLLSRYAGEFNEWIDEVLKVLQAADKIVVSILPKVHDGNSKNMQNPTKSTTITERAKALKDKGNELLESYRVAYEKSKGLRKQVEDAIGLLEGKIQEDLNGIKNHIKQELKKVIDALNAGIGKVVRESWSRTVIQEFYSGIDNNDAPKLRSWAEQGKSDGTLFTAIRDFEEGGCSIDKFKDILKKLGEKQPGGIFYNVLTDDLDRKVDEELKDDGSNSKVKLGVLATYNAEKQKNTNAGGQYEIALDAVENVLQAFQNRKAFTSSDKLNSGDIKEAVSEVERHFADITTELEAIAKLVDKDASTSSGQTDGIRQKIKKVGDLVGKGTQQGLAKIVSDLKTLQSTDVLNLQKSVNILISTTVPKAVIDCTRSIQTNLHEEVENATHAIKRDTFNRYVSSKIKELTDLKEFVEKQRQQIEKTIYTDVSTGMKGLLSVAKAALPNTISSVNLQSTLSDATTKFREYYGNIWAYILSQIDMHPSKYNAKELNTTFIELLFQIITNDHFHTNVFDKIVALNGKLEGFYPEKFAEATPLLNIMKVSITKFNDELRKHYVSAYSGKKLMTWVAYKGSVSVPSTDATQCARVFLSIMYALHRDLSRLRDGILLNGWKEHRTVLGNPLGDILKRCGYGVSKSKSKQNGEIKNDMNGRNIFALLKKENNSLFENEAFKGVVIDLSHDIKLYFRVCHLRFTKSTKHPCTVRDMLSWICGIPYTTVYSKIKQHCRDLLNDKVDGTDKTPNKDDDVIRKILESELCDSLSSTCRFAYEVLVTIQGHGCGFKQADYPYACNFCDNSRNFYYPHNVPDLLDMLKEICTRLLRALYFLYCQCQHTASDCKGWQDCSYGKGVQGYQWSCEKSSHTGAECDVKSPLQSHLMDGLPGLLPHNLTSVGCKSVCSTCPKVSPDQQCITPMGFWDLTSMASITKNGHELYETLAGLCDNPRSPLPTLLRSLMSVLPYPPTSLSDMFSFYSHVMQIWNGTQYCHSVFYKPKLDGTIDSFLPLWSALHGNYEAQHLTDSIKALHHSSGEDMSNTNGKHCDLLSISIYGPLCYDAKNVCGPYLEPLCHDAHHTYPAKHTSLYLSWILYLAWDFWHLLNSLLTAFTNVSCKSSGCSSCNCDSGKHGISAEELTKPGCHCKSVVECQGVLSTLYQYGFTYGDTLTLNAAQLSKTCGNFYTQLTKVLKSQYFTKLFEECDNFLWAIRLPFSCLLLALWLLSLLYLLHIMVIRLDLLHIKSHLHSPSSHRIAAQSLLAAARVGKLAKISYLQA